ETNYVHQQIASLAANVPSRCGRVDRAAIPGINGAGRNRPRPDRGERQDAIWRDLLSPWRNDGQVDARGRRLELRSVRDPAAARALAEPDQHHQRPEPSAGV